MRRRAGQPFVDGTASAESSRLNIGGKLDAVVASHSSAPPSQTVTALRRLHFETLQPVCPVCRQADASSSSRLRLSHLLEGDNDQVLQGVLVCSQATCQREYPIVDGVPILVRDLRSYIAAQIIPLYGREDLSPVLESVVGDCCGPASAFETNRQQVGSYAWDHYGEFGPASGPFDDRQPPPGAIVRLWEAASRLTGLDAASSPNGPRLDVGCGPGRIAWKVADATGDLTLGVDLHFGMLRLAQQTLRDGRIRYAKRRIGLVYERQEFACAPARPELIDYWCFDAAAPPFAPGQFASVTAFNVLDATPSPLELLAGLAHLLAPGGTASIASPYDWSAAVTPLEHWLGGHSQRGPDAGDGAALLRRVLAGGVTPDGRPVWKLLGEDPAFPWSVRLHDRSVSQYLVHLAAVARSAD